MKSMKKLISCFLLAAMLVTAVPFMSLSAEETATTETTGISKYTKTDESWYDATQKEFTLTTANQLAGFDKKSKDNAGNFSDVTITLGADMDMSGYTWLGTGTFVGTFNGNGHTIYNINSVDGRGMFGYAVGTIENFTLIDPIVGKSATASVGAIVGDRNKNGYTNDKPLTIDNVHVVNGTVTGGTSVGGILGNTNDGGKGIDRGDPVVIQNCSFSGTVSGTGNVGGVLGYMVNASAVTISNVCFNGEIKATSTYAGGAIGNNNAGAIAVVVSVQNSTFKGSISASGNGCGGVMGFLQNGGILDVDNCYIDMNLSGAGNHKGGLVGRVATGTTANTVTNVTVDNCFVSGQINSMASARGGIFGWINDQSPNTSTVTCNNVMVSVGSVTTANTYGFPAIATVQTKLSGSVHTFTNVWFDNTLTGITKDENGNGATFATFVGSPASNTPSFGTTETYGGKTTEELQAIKMTDWTSREGDYPIPTALLNQGSTFLADSVFTVGSQVKVNADGTKDIRFVFGLKNMKAESLSKVGAKLTLTYNGTSSAPLTGDCFKLFTEVQGGGKTYTAAELNADYLFVVVLKGVGADVTGFDAVINPYFALTNSETLYENSNTTINKVPATAGTLLVEEILELTWNIGYVASDKHATSPNQLVAGGGSYSYTDVFTVAKAGTTITFTDDNTNSNGDTNFASASAYVVSSWKQDGDGWVLDTEGANYAGSGSIKSDILVAYDSAKCAVTYSYTTTLDNEHLRLCFRSGETKNFRPEAYPQVTAALTGAAGTAKDRLLLNQWIADSQKNSFSANLQGLTISAIGDSYFQGDALPTDQVWLNLLARKYDMPLHNYGKNGSTVSDYVTNLYPMCDRYTSMTDAGVDIILVEGGRNDFNQNVPLGEVNSTDTKTYSGALNVIIDGLQKQYPDAMIVCLTPWNFPNANSLGLTYRDYADAMMAVAAAQGVYCIEACDPAVSGVDMTDAAFKAQYSMNGTSISHLNLEGMKLVMSHFEPLLAKLYQEFCIAREG